MAGVVEGLCLVEMQSRSSLGLQPGTQRQGSRQETRQKIRHGEAVMREYRSNSQLWKESSAGAVQGSMGGGAMAVQVEVEAAAVVAAVWGSHPRHISGEGTLKVKVGGVAC